LQSFVGHLERTARESVQALGQKWKACSVDRAGEWPQCKVRFEADSEAEAQTAWTLWAESSGRAFGAATGRICNTSMRGMRPGCETSGPYRDSGGQPRYRLRRPRLRGAVPPEPRNSRMRVGPMTTGRTRPRRRAARE
jgi:hypothetical protein